MTRRSVPVAGASANWDIVTDVGLTALAVAAGRAMETHRDGGLVSDPYAEAFVRAAAPPIALPTRLEAAGDDPDIPWTAMARYMGVRSRYFDEYLATAATAGVPQVVLLAAGLDTRAFRMGWPEGTTVYELDAPKVLDFKDRVLTEQGAQARARRQVVAVDLREEWTQPLQQAGFDPSRPSAWLAEGLLPFLPNAAKRRLLSAVNELTVTGSSVELEHIDDLAGLRRDPRLREQQARMAERMNLDITRLWPDEENFPVGTWLAEHGWTVTSERADDVARRYGRPLAEQAMLPIRAGLFVTARRAGTP
ncbi:SAM-dependent methyltransferase [Nocardia sp. alder85J]|uniref:SAM-dependent methyltransferase n=1 Tax=Nocardia sp. alder85J TaxID=2862949 RepID=UPI001CD3B5EC|nr:SAM-dependent methyltransferase [Nocardia sp. alder85J]MCX4093893.1 SAM-dependent methyltransferase [Nocardia sp. alder85J]